MAYNLIYDIVCPVNVLVILISFNYVISMYLEFLFIVQINESITPNVQSW